MTLKQPTQVTQVTQMMHAMHVMHLMQVMHVVQVMQEMNKNVLIAVILEDLLLAGSLVCSLVRLQV